MRILMLGWEFPPYLNGGLGVATAGLAQALAPRVELTLVIPRSSPDYRAQGYRLMGLHGQAIPEIRSQYLTQEIEYLRQVKVEYLPVDITGYERIERRYEPIERTHWLRVEKQVPQTYVERPMRQFFIDHLYGPNLVDKVIEFSEMLVERAAAFDFDLIHAHDWMTFLAGLELKALTGKPLVLHVHSLEYDRGGADSRNWIFELEQHALRQADAVLPVSQYTADILVRIYGVPPARLHPIPNGIEPFEGYRSPRPFPEKLISFLGRITNQKGPEYFFEAAAKLLEQRRDLRFVIAGRGEQIERLIERCAAARLGDRIHFTGHLESDRVRKLLAMTDVFVLPSVSEPFGLAALEAAQMDVPCLISQNSGVAEVLPSALSVDYADTDAMAARVQRLLNDEALRQQVIAGQRRDLERATWDGAAHRIERIYQQLTEV